MDDACFAPGSEDAAWAASSAPSQRALLELERRQGRTQRAAALGALVARLAHELGTPLHSIAGHLDLMLEDEGTPARTRQRIEVVAGEVQRLSKLIRRYLEHLRAPAPAPRPVDLARLARDVTSCMEPLIRRAGVRIAFDVTPGAEAPFHCDRDQIEQVLVNLLKNALDAMPDGGDLTIRLDRGEGSRVLSVADTGTGIAPDVREHVFEPFFTTKGGGRGTGLGLAICREIARAHGGDIRLDSRPGVGTVVTLTLHEQTEARS